MVIQTKFDIFEKVAIIPLDGNPGRIMKIIQNGNDLWYEVEYWTDGMAKCVQLADFDLDKIMDNPILPAVQKHGCGNSIKQDNPW